MDTKYVTSFQAFSNSKIKWCVEIEDKKDYPNILLVICNDGHEAYNYSISESFIFYLKNGIDQLRNRKPIMIHFWQINKDNWWYYKRSIPRFRIKKYPRGIFLDCFKWNSRLFSINIIPNFFLKEKDG